MKTLIIIGSLLWAITAHAIPCTLHWDTPSTGIPDGYVVYRGPSVGSYTLLANLVIASFPDQSKPSFRVPDCQAGQHYVVTAYNQGFLESPYSNDLLLQQLAQIQNLRVIFEIVIPATPQQ